MKLPDYWKVKYRLSYNGRLLGYITVDIANNNTSWKVADNQVINTCG